MESKVLNVLVAEDEMLVAESLEGMLEDIGHKVAGHAVNGLKAVELAGQLHPDIILMDIKMPELNGLEAARRIFEDRPTPIVVLTAYDSRDLVEKASSVGVAAYLTKPTDHAELDRVLTIAAARFGETQNLRERNEELSRDLDRLQGVMEILPMCSGCRSVRDRDGQWRTLEAFLKDNFNIKFSHGICQDCMTKLYEEYTDEL